MNKALLFGGAVHLIKESNNLKTIWDIKNCLFQSNSAELGGGAIKYTGSLPNFLSNTSIKHNKAPYGPDQLSFPSHLAFKNMKSPSDENLFLNLTS